MHTFDMHIHDFGEEPNPEVKAIIEKWYLTLKFPEVFHREFYKALETVRISDAVTLEQCDLECTDGKRNLLTFLFLCEQLEKRYQEKGISRQILLDTLQDIVTYTRIWSELKGALYLGELKWLTNHLSMRLFRLGRLQFCMATQKDGKEVLEIHIPEGGPLIPEDCDKSIMQAKQFFATYYGEFDYQYFTCHSWLLDSTLATMLPVESNILQFRKRFQIVSEEESYILLRYIFRWDTNVSNLRNAVCTSRFATKVRKKVLQGVKFHEAFGIILSE